MTKRTVLVTGAAGFIGSHLVDSLKSRGYQIRGFMHGADPAFPLTEGVEWIRGDLKNEEDCRRAVANCEIVFHLAALSRHDAKVPDREYMRVNVGATRSLLEASHEHGIRKFIFVSSIEAVGISTDGHPLTEESEAHPRNIYGKSKLEAEKVVQSFHRIKGLDCVIVRLGCTYGPGEKLMFERMFKPIRRGIYPIFGDGNALMEFGFVKNQVHGILQAAEHGKAGEVYFLSDPRPYRFKAVVSEIGRQMGVPVRLIFIPNRLAWVLALTWELASRIFPIRPFYIKETGRPAFSRNTVRWATKSVLFCDNSKAKNEIQYAPPYSLEDGIKESVDWYRDRKWL